MIAPQFPSPSCLERGAEGTPFFLNEKYCVRSADDSYGRAITQLRKSLTKDDSEPFAVI
jgi:hypothetical protein